MNDYIYWVIKRKYKENINLICDVKLNRMKFIMMWVGIYMYIRDFVVIVMFEVGVREFFFLKCCNWILVDLIFNISFMCF